MASVTPQAAASTNTITEKSAPLGQMNMMPRRASWRDAPAAEGGVIGNRRAGGMHLQQRGES